MTVQPKQLTRRGVALFEKNPYVVAASVNTNEGTKRKTLRSQDGTTLMITSQSGEVVAPAGFWQTQEVDKTQFVKLYVNGVKAFRELTAAGAKMFAVLYLEVQGKVGKDRVYLSFNAIQQEITPMSEATYTRGMRELVSKEFIAPSVLQGWYFINPDYMWNGDRLAFVKEYRLKRDESSDARYREQLEARGQQRLGIDPGTGEAA
mgnify:FL=1